MSIRIPNWQKPKWLIAGTVCSVIGTLITLKLNLGNSINGLISTFPLLPIPFAIPDESFVKKHGLIGKFILLVTILFLGIMLLLWPASGGKQWGARYLLPAIPLLVYLAGFVFTKLIKDASFSLHQQLIVCVVVMIINSLAIQFSGLSTLRKEQQFFNTIHSAVQEMPAEIVLSTGPYLPSQIMAGIDKIFYVY